MVETYKVELHITNGDTVEINKGSICTFERKVVDKKQRKKTSGSHEINFMRGVVKEEDIVIDIENTMLYITSSIGFAHCIPLSAICYFNIVRYPRTWYRKFICYY